MLIISIGKGTFKSSIKLKSADIKSTTFNKTGDNAFSGNKSLKKITLKNPLSEGINSGRGFSS